MTVTLETIHIPTQQESYRSSDEVAESVQAVVKEIIDEYSELHKSVYGFGGLEPTALQEVQRPAAGHRLLLKNETHHSISFEDGSTAVIEAFKRRGALVATYKALQRNPYLRSVSTASAGNHGLGVAAAAKQFGLEAHIHTATTLSEVKENKMKALGAIIHKQHDTFKNALTAAELRTSHDKDMAYIHAYDSIETIAGQSTVGLEVLSDLASKHHSGEINLSQDKIQVVLPVGGGGLAAGVAVVLKQAKDEGVIGDNVRVATAELVNKQFNTWSDGTATETGTLPGLVLSDSTYVQEQILVNEIEVADAMHTLTGVYNKKIEPAGALAYAGAMQLGRNQPVPHGFDKMTFVIPVTGANVTKESYEYAEQLRSEHYHSGMKSLTAMAVRRLVVTEPTNHSHRRIHIADGYHS